MHSAKVDQPFGRTSLNPLPPELLQEKFVNCALRVLPESNVAQLHAAIEKFEQINDVRELTALITAHQKSPARTKALEFVQRAKLSEPLRRSSGHAQDRAGWVNWIEFPILVSHSARDAVCTHR